MSPRSMSSPNARHLVRLALLAVALLGVLAMHGLATHGVSHGGSGSAGTSMVGGMHGDHGVPDSDGAPEGDDATVMVLCLALLGTAVIGLFQLRSRGVRARRRIVALAHQIPTPSAAARDRDPPDLHRLSIQRC